MQVGFAEIEVLGTWRNRDVRDAMVICGIGLALVAAGLAFLKARTGWRKARWLLPLIYLFAPVFQGIIAHSIANARAPENCVVGLWLSMGTWYDILVTIGAAPVFGVIVGLLISVAFKRSAQAA